jgi:hypothetical protein
MTNQHPITPPPELLQKWYEGKTTYKMDMICAAQWGADMELEACCEWLDKSTVGMAELLHTSRRPKPLSLKEQALYALDEAESSSCLHLNGLGDTIRRALEALPND